MRLEGGYQADLRLVPADSRGAGFVISTDAQAADALAKERWGVQMARRAWLGPDAILNTRDVDALRPLLRRHKSA